MIQLTDTQLQVALRALNDVIAPALQESDSHVIEQAHLVIATLEFAKQRLPHTRRFYRQELLYFIDYASEVAALVAAEADILAEEISDQCRIGQEELQRPEAEAEDYVIVVRRLRELISSAVERTAGSAIEAELSRLVLERLKRFLPHQRTWLLPFGLDPAPDDLPAVDQIVELQQS